mmetsp:Transcript_10495/g.22106  ORF Transcript_10495/g.22106 Transcript_10495/m.22106 type:complete len:251 (+) Transcript_10495:272-1024(+)
MILGMRLRLPRVLSWSSIAFLRPALGLVIIELVITELHESIFDGFFWGHHVGPIAKGSAAAVHLKKLHDVDPTGHQQETEDGEGDHSHETRYRECFHPVEATKFPQEVPIIAFVFAANLGNLDVCVVVVSLNGRPTPFLASAVITAPVGLVVRVGVVIGGVVVLVVIVVVALPDVVAIVVVLVVVVFAFVVAAVVLVVGVVVAVIAVIVRAIVVALVQLAARSRAKVRSFGWSSSAVHNIVGRVQCYEEQ